MGAKVRSAAHGSLTARPGYVGPIKVSVVIPTYNRADGLREAIAPLLADPDLHEVVVVVDGSRDGSMELLEELAARDPRLRPLWIENQREMGARQAGAEAAMGDVVLLLDDDVIATPGLAAGHARHHEREPGLVVVGYMPVTRPAPTDRRPDDVAKFVYSTDYERRCAEYDADPASILPGLWAGNLSLRREDAVRVGMNNPGLVSNFHRDREFGLRLQAIGLRGVFDRELRAEHRYERPLAKFLTDAYGQGVGQAVIHQTHPERAPLDSIEPFSANVPAPVRPLLGLARRPRLQQPFTRATHTTVNTLGRLRAWRLQEAGAKLLRLLEQQRGALEQLRRAPTEAREAAARGGRRG